MNFGDEQDGSDSSEAGSVGEAVEAMFDRCFGLDEEPTDQPRVSASGE